MKNIPGTMLVLLMAVLLTIPASRMMAQPDQRMNRFHEEKVKFFTDKMNLSEKEAALFWPVHDDLHNRNRKVNEEERVLLDYYNSNYEAMSKEEVSEQLDKFMQLQKKRVDLSMQYHVKFVGILGEKKTMRMYALEHEFKKHILNEFRRGRGPGGGGRNRDRCP